MSRHSLSESYYGQIKLKCPHGHELGAIMVQPRRPAAGQKQTLAAALLIPAAPAHADDCRPAPNGIELCKHDDGSVTACAAWLPGGCQPWGGVFPPPPPQP